MVECRLSLDSWGQNQHRINPDENSCKRKSKMLQICYRTLELVALTVLIFKISENSSNSVIRMSVNHCIWAFYPGRILSVGTDTGLLTGQQELACLTSVEACKTHLPAPTPAPAPAPAPTPPLPCPLQRPGL